MFKNYRDVTMGNQQLDNLNKLLSSTTIENITSEKDTGEEVSRVEFK